MPLWHEERGNKAIPGEANKASSEHQRGSKCANPRAYKTAATRPPLPDPKPNPNNYDNVKQPAWQFSRRGGWNASTRKVGGSGTARAEGRVLGVGLTAAVRAENWRRVAKGVG